MSYNTEDDTWKVRYDDGHIEENEPAAGIVLADYHIISKIGKRVSRVRSKNDSIIGGTVVDFHPDGQTKDGVPCIFLTIQYDDDPAGTDTDDLEWDELVIAQKLFYNSHNNDDIGIVAQIGKRVARRSTKTGDTVCATIVGYHANGKTKKGESVQLWQIRYDDGDTEDLEDYELEEAEKMFWSDCQLVLKNLTKCGFIKVGKKTLQIKYFEKIYYGDLNSDFTISWDGKKYVSLSNWSGTVKNRPDNGWTSVKCNFGGKLRQLFELRNVLGGSWLRQKQSSSLVSGKTGKTGKKRKPAS